jgi:hypothetical protein
MWYILFDKIKYIRKDNITIAGEWQQNRRMLGAYDL